MRRDGMSIAALRAAIAVARQTRPGLARRLAAVQAYGGQS